MLWDIVRLTGYTEQELEDTSPEFILRILRGANAYDAAMAELRLRNAPISAGGE